MMRSLGRFAKYGHKIVFGLGLLFVMAIEAQAEQKLYFVHNDHLGTPQLLTDENQTVVWKAEYTPFGEAAVDEDPDGDGVNIEFNLRFPGQYYDKETDTAYNIYRTYDAKTGRYDQSDPIGLAGGINTYGYVLQNPIKYIDPLGLDWIYSQSTGSLSHQNNSTGVVTSHGIGYSGNGVGLNNPSKQDIPFVGPIPEGEYQIGAPHNGKGPLTLPLIPDPKNNMFGRSDFAIHGDNSCMCNNASEGCIIVSRPARQAIVNSGDPVIQVIP